MTLSSYFWSPNNRKEMWRKIKALCKEIANFAKFPTIFCHKTLIGISIGLTLNINKAEKNQLSLNYFTLKSTMKFFGTMQYFTNLGSLWLLWNFNCFYLKRCQHKKKFLPGFRSAKASPKNPDLHLSQWKPSFKITK